MIKTNVLSLFTHTLAVPARARRGSGCGGRSRRVAIFMDQFDWRNGEKGEKMKKSFMGRVIGLVSLFMILFLLIQGVMQSYSSRKHFYQSADLSINQIHELLKRNEEGEINLRDSLKDDYIIRAQACSYIIENSNISEQDVREMKKIAELLEVDEIHLFDVDGSIYAGTNPEYYGYNFDSGEQMSFFKPMLSDYNLSRFSLRRIMI